jgi:hypothetical protein
MDQSVINVMISAIMMLMGGIIKAIWDGVKELQKENKAITDKVSGVELLVAGDYARKDYVEGKVDAIFTKLDKMDDKLDLVRKECHT